MRACLEVCLPPAVIAVLYIASIYAIMKDVRVTLDTNVLYQSLHSRRGASYAILRLVRSGELHLAVSVPVYQEYQDVLLRSRVLTETGLGRDDMLAVLDFIALVAIPTAIDFLWRPNLRDESDNMFVELAIASGSEFLITRNRRHYVFDGALKFDSFSVVTPMEFLTQWRKYHGWESA